METKRGKKYGRYGNNNHQEEGITDWYRWEGPQVLNNPATYRLSFPPVKMKDANLGLMPSAGLLTMHGFSQNKDQGEIILIIQNIWIYWPVQPTWMMQQ
jgi:hypothetical protein